MATATTSAEVQARDVTRLEPLVCFLYCRYIFIYFNYTKKHLKVQYLRIEKAGAAGKGDGTHGRWRLGIRGGARDTACLKPRCVFLIIRYYYTDCVYGTTNDSDWDSRRDVSRAPATSKSIYLYYIYTLLTFITDRRSTQKWMGSRRVASRAPGMFIYILH